MTTVDVVQGDSPLVLGFPHTGTWRPDALCEAFNETGLAKEDTDWHIDRVYAGLVEGATSVRTRVHGYAIDANRDPSGVSLYPGQNTTGVCPATTFDNVRIYTDGAEPAPPEVSCRIEAYHETSHAALRAQLDRVHALHGFAVLYDCYSIRSRVPFLFEGVLPDFNIGTNGGQTCAPQIERHVLDGCRQANRSNEGWLGRGV